MSTWLITGCSTGLGRHLAKAVLERGHNAVVTARDATTVRDLAETYPDTALALALDVTAQRQITRRDEPSRRALRCRGRAREQCGYGYRAAVEEGEEDAVAQLFATNLSAPSR